MDWVSLRKLAPALKILGMMEPQTIRRKRSVHTPKGIIG